jgi:Flp pilus assembly protein TadD
MAQLPEATSFAAARVATAGRFLTFSPMELRALVAAAGGALLPHLSARATHLVVGQATWPLASNRRLLRQVRRLQRRRAGEQALWVISELEFARLVAAEQMPAQLTFEPLAEEPKPCRLRQEGVPRRRLEQAWRQLQACGASQRATMMRSLKAEGRRLVTRTAHGEACEPNGQRLFDFYDNACDGADDAGPALLPWPVAVSNDPLNAAVDLEEAGCDVEAAEAYQTILQGNPGDSTAWFNLGNVLYRLADLAGSRRAFERSLALAEHNAGAWNNLGAVLLDLGDLAAARQSWRRALAIDPEHAEARENATSLRQLRGANRLGF